MKKRIVSIENVVSSASVNQRVDLLEIVKRFTNVSYDPKQFPGLVFRLKNPKIAALIFGSGKMVCTGAKSEEQSFRAVRTVVNILREGGIDIKGEPTIEVQNIVASVNLGESIDLEKAAEVLPHSMYEPEQFPGLIYRMQDPKVVILLFASGKLVCTGAKRESDIYIAAEKFHKLLESEDLILR